MSIFLEATKFFAPEIKIIDFGSNFFARFSTLVNDDGANEEEKGCSFETRRPRTLGDVTGADSFARLDQYCINLPRPRPPRRTASSPRENAPFFFYFFSVSAKFSF